MKKSKIEWTETTWNPITGCTKISDGCKNCYAETKKEYVIITWPDSQELMDEEWFDDECILINEDPLLSQVGSSAYFVPIARLKNK